MRRVASLYFTHRHKITNIYLITSFRARPPKVQRQILLSLLQTIFCRANQTKQNKTKRKINFDMARLLKKILMKRDCN